MKRLLFLLPLGVFAAVLAAFLLGLRHDPSHITSMLIDKRLPPFVLPSVRGDEGLASADFRGQPMLLNVFASWCVACRQEHELLLELKRQGIAIQGLDWKDAAADGARYLADSGDPYQKAGNDESGRAGIDLGVAGVPETFVIDSKGRVRFKLIGPMMADDWQGTIKPLLQRLRSET